MAGIYAINHMARLRALEERLETGGGPPHNDGMEARLAALEDAVKGLPTKADFAGLRADFSELRADLAKGQADMHKAIADNHRWTHGALVGIAGLSVAGVIGMMATVWNASKPGPTPTPTAQQAPIIINVPAPPPPAPAQAQ